jgi:hypothetical protein
MPGIMEKEPVCRNGANGWRRVSRAHPCPICEKPDWCLVSADGTAAICARMESSKRCGDAGWLHRLQDRPWYPTRRIVRMATPSPAIGLRHDLERLAAQYQAAVDPGRLFQLARSLGLSTQALTALDIGWCCEEQSWAFPMSDARGKVLGIRLRRPNGFKFSVKGGREGLFIPRRVGQGRSGSVPGGTPLMICEGATDTAALLDMGFDSVVGRPSCTGGVQLLIELVKVRQRPEIVIISDNDAPGRHGAENLASVLAMYAPAVRIIQPPHGIKDARAWRQAGANRGDLERAITVAPARCIVICARRAQRTYRGEK